MATIPPVRRRLPWLTGFRVINVLSVWRQKKPLVSHHIFMSDCVKKGSDFIHGDQNPKKLITIVVCTRPRQRTTGSSAYPLMAPVDPFRSPLLREIDRDGKGKELNKCGRLTSVNTLCEHTAHDKVAQ